MAIKANIPLEVKNLYCAFDGVQAVTDFSCDIGPGTIAALIGPNGAGKTTVFNLFCGYVRPDAGHIFLSGLELTDKTPDKIASLGLGRTFQDCKVFDQLSVLENVMLGFRNPRSETLFAALAQRSSLQEFERESRQRALALLEDAGLIDKHKSQAYELSYGQRKLLELCRVRALDPNIFLLDEPFAGLFPGTADRMGDTICGLSDAGRSVMLIEHDMNVVARLADRAIVMDFGCLIADDTPQKVLNDPAVLAAYLGKSGRDAS